MFYCNATAIIIIINYYKEMFLMEAKNLFKRQMFEYSIDTSIEFLA